MHWILLLVYSTMGELATYRVYLPAVSAVVIYMTIHRNTCTSLMESPKKDLILGMTRAPIV